MKTKGTRIAMVCLLIPLLGAMVFADKVTDLPELMQPAMMATDGIHLFVLDGIKVHVYRMRDWSHVRSFGKKGNGPGEFTTNFVNRISLILDSKHLFLANINKMARFSKAGKFLMEKSFPFVVIQVVPLGDKYVITRFMPGEGGINSQSVRIYDANLKEVANLYSRPDISMQRSRKLDCPNEQIFVRVHDQKVYIHDQRPGTHVRVFDAKGKKLTEAALPVQRIPMPQRYKDEVIEWSRTAITQMADFQNRSGLTMEQILEMIDFHKILPGARYFLVQPGGEMLIETYEKKADKARFLCFTTAGKITGEFMLTDAEPGRVKMTPHSTYTVHENRYYYLKDNPDEETWELHAEVMASEKE